VFTEQSAKLLMHAEAFRCALPRVTLLSGCPVLVRRRSGELAIVTGYDAESGVLAQGPAPEAVPLEEAVMLLNGILGDFNFTTPSDRSRALAALVTPAMAFGGLLGGRAPVDLGEADQSQSGKGYRNKLITVDGAVTGNPPATDTLGFRWSGVHNLFLTAGDLAADEWRASRAADEESAEREMRQFVWCLPVMPASLSQTHLEVHELAGRAIEPAKGLVPHKAIKVTVGIDLGKYLCHWSAVAWSSGATGHVLDYGRMEVPSADLGVEQALLVTLRQFKEMILTGWAVANPDGAVDRAAPRVVPELVLVDAGYTTQVVYAFCRETGLIFPTKNVRGSVRFSSVAPRRSRG
jgi:hypothetical protein